MHGKFAVAGLAAVLALSAPASVRARATPDLGRRDLALERQFTPIVAPGGTYVVSTVARSIEEVAASLKSLDTAPVPGAWSLAHPEAHEAFGQAGLYDRYRLAQLFGGRRLKVARGSLIVEGHRIAYTLISPYPDGTLSRIVAGTMVIQVRLDEAAREGRL